MNESKLAFRLEIVAFITSDLESHASYKTRKQPRGPIDLFPTRFVKKGSFSKRVNIFNLFVNILNQHSAVYNMIEYIEPRQTFLCK